MRLIYLSPVPWCSFVQRPHEFVSYFRKSTNGEVLWIDPYPTRLPILADLMRLKGNNGTSWREVPEGLTVLRALALPLEPIPVVAACNGPLWTSIVRKANAFALAGETALVIGKPSALALTMLSTLTVAWSMYDAMDDFPAFYAGISRWSMTRYERAIAQRVSRVLASSTNLAQKFSKQARDVVLVLNGCRSDLPGPREQRRDAARPLIGYAGTLGWWFDWELVSDLARSRPDCDFRLIGPLFSKPPRELPANVELRPAVGHAQVPMAIRDFDVGLIPFKRNLLTSSVDPIKFYECRAMGVPVVSSAFGEMATRSEEDGVFLLGARAGYAEVFGEALRHRSDAQSVMRFRETNSWEKRFDSARLFAEIARDTGTLQPECLADSLA